MQDRQLHSILFDLEARYSQGGVYWSNDYEKGALAVIADIRLILDANPMKIDEITDDDRKWADEVEKVERHRIEHFNINARQRQQKEAIVEILDILIEYSPYDPMANVGIRRDYKLGKQATALKAKLVGER